LILIIALSCMVGSFSYMDIYTNHWYIFSYGVSNQSLSTFITFISYINLAALIPLSLYVTLGNLVILAQFDNPKISRIC
jgi:hypothetical protein